MYSRPILAFRNSASFSLCDLQVSDIQDSSSSRTRLYSDEPPPYDLVTSDHYLSRHLNPHTADPESPHTHLPVAATAADGYQNNDSTTSVHDNDDEVFNAAYSDDYLQPPPHYEDFIRQCENIRTTRL